MPACREINNELGYPDASCTAPSPLAGIAQRFDLVATMPDGSKRYLTPWPFDYGSEFSWSWSADSLGSRSFTQKVRCGTISLSGVPTGTATVTGRSGPRLSITIDGVVYASQNAPASVTLTAPQPLGSPTYDDNSGPFFDFRVSGTLVASTGAAIGIEGRMRNTVGGNGERGLGRRNGAIGGPGNGAPGLWISGDRLILATILMGTAPNMLSLDLALGSDKMVPLPDTMGLTPFPDGTFLAYPTNTSGSAGYYLASYDASLALRWKTPLIMRSSLYLSGTLARNDGSGCIMLAGGTFPFDVYPSLMTCTDATGTPLWQKNIYPVGQPRAATELADGTLVVADVRTPEVMGLKPNGDKRFEIVPCLSNPTTDRQPFYKTSGVARNAGGGAVAQIGDEVISFSADGQLQWRTLMPLGDSEPLVAADGTVYAVSGGPAYVVALGAGGSVTLDPTRRRERKSHRPGRRWHDLCPELRPEQPLRAERAARGRHRRLVGLDRNAELDTVARRRSLRLGQGLRRSREGRLTDGRFAVARDPRQRPPRWHAVGACSVGSRHDAGAVEAISRRLLEAALVGHHRNRPSARRRIGASPT